MHPVVSLLLIGLVALLGHVVPKKYNAYFQRKYHEDAVSMPLAVVTAIFASLWLIFMDVEGFWYWFLLIGTIALSVVSVVYAICVSLQVGAGAFEIAFAIFAQILAIAGIAILIISVFAMIMEGFGGKKKKRKR